MPGTRRSISHLWRQSLFCVLSMSTVSSTASAQFTPFCRVSNFYFVSEGITPATMWIPSGGGCQFQFGMDNSVCGLVGILYSHVTLRPNNGLLGKNTIRIFVHKPKDEFVEKVQFELRVRYNGDDKTGERSTLPHVIITVL
jgi:hypothetical protein